MSEADYASSLFGAERRNGPATAGTQSYQHPADGTGPAAEPGSRRPAPWPHI